MSDLTLGPLPIIRTSDRNQWRRCRVAWNFSSKLRGNLEYSPGIEPLDFGSAIHEGMEVLYDPKRWTANPEIKEVQYLEAIAAFRKWMFAWKKRMVATGFWEAQKERYEELMELGEGMLWHYIEWAKPHDTNWKPLYTEIEFEVPIPVPSEHYTRVNAHPMFRTLHLEGQEEYTDSVYLHTLYGSKWVPVYYQGRIDLIVEDLTTHKYWIVDHKTAAQFGNTEWLDLDTQGGSYVWAIKQMLGIDVDGVIYNQLRKKAPEPPAQLKNGSLSKNKSQNTTVIMFRKELERLGLSSTPYEEFLSTFEGQEYFRRPEILRSQDELRQIAEDILTEAMDMLGDPSIYPNPGMFTCGSCQFKQPCMMRQDGSDYEWYISNSGLYNRRGGTN